MRECGAREMEEGSRVSEAYHLSRGGGKGRFQLVISFYFYLQQRPKEVVNEVPVPVPVPGARKDETTLVFVMISVREL